jgi:hypothetical protein
VSQFAKTRTGHGTYKSQADNAYLQRNLT